MLCLAALHGMVALVGSEGDVMQVKKKKKKWGRHLNVCIVTAGREYPVSQHAKEDRYMLMVMVTLGSLVSLYMLLAKNSFCRNVFLVLFGL